MKNSNLIYHPYKARMCKNNKDYFAFTVVSNDSKGKLIYINGVVKADAVRFSADDSVVYIPFPKVSINQNYGVKGV